MFDPGPDAARPDALYSESDAAVPPPLEGCYGVDTDSGTMPGITEASSSPVE